MTKNLGLSVLCACALVSPLHAAPPVNEEVAKSIRSFIEAKEIAGAVTLVADGEKILHLSADGFSDIDSKKPMAEDSVFWIASMSKPVTATAVMMMQDEGKLSVDDPVSKYLPEFSGDKSGITIKQCLTHSSGLSDLSGEEVKGVTTLKDLVPLFTAKPLQFAPDSKWSYCQTGINTAARVVEVVSGKSFPEFLQERLFDPLGMKDTSFYPGEETSSRLASAYKRTEAGELEKAPLFFLGGSPPWVKNRYPMANGGLFSTAGDYAKFAQMILNGGESGGKRYVKSETVKQMTTVQSGDLATGFTPGNGWGLGWCVVREPQGITAALSSGTFGHGGLFGTQAWIDPVKKRIYLLLIQRANFTNQGGSDGSDIRRDFQNAAAK
ncbi:beta-lactamase family protein [Luteolibacter yonseiensis]|uniref:Beta-lactamase family protein n=1 Tax=Luteolibacter yonseiensis TaxID=1144680 RepID=A0A934R3X3_9BACT|nr:serine hydrolase domain-containing protein [Luteolibacter yonseiensis]MBK1814744.1 beta-lactamase family protein [Luteolibacter yonseiensis]